MSVEGVSVNLAPVNPQLDHYVIVLDVGIGEPVTVARAGFSSAHSFEVEILDAGKEHTPGQDWLFQRIQAQFRFFFIDWVDGEEASEKLDASLSTGLNLYQMLQWHRVTGGERKPPSPNPIPLEDLYISDDVSPDYIKWGIAHFLDRDAPPENKKEDPFFDTLQAFLFDFFDWKAPQLFKACGLAVSSKPGDYRGKDWYSATNDCAYGVFGNDGPDESGSAYADFRVFASMREIGRFEIAMNLQRCPQDDGRIAPISFFESGMYFELSMDDDEDGEDEDWLLEALDRVYSQVFPEGMDFQSDFRESDIDPKKATIPWLLLHLCEVTDPWIAIWQYIGGLDGLRQLSEDPEAETSRDCGFTHEDTSRKMDIVHGWVDRLGEHFALTLGDDGRVVGYLARKDETTAVLEINVGTQEPDYEEVLNEIQNNIRFYLIEKGEPNPWGYLIYHCGTGANAYGNLHFSYFPDDWRQAEVRPWKTWTPGDRKLDQTFSRRRRLGIAPRGILFADDVDEGFVLIEVRSTEPDKDDGDSMDWEARYYQGRENRARAIRRLLPDLEGSMDREAARLVNETLPQVEQSIDSGDPQRATTMLAKLLSKVQDLAGGGSALLALSATQFVAGKLAWQSDNYEDAAMYLRDALDSARWYALDHDRDEARPHLANILSALGQFLLETGNAGMARDFLMDALVETEMDFTIRDGDPDATDRLGAVLFAFGDTYFDDGDYENARVLYHKAMAILEAVLAPGEDSDRAHALQGLYERMGDMAYLADDCAEACSWYRKYLDRAVALDGPRRDQSIAGACSRLTDATLKMGDLEAADRYSKKAMEAVSSFSTDGSRSDVRAFVDAHIRRGNVEAKKGNMDAASSLFRTAVEADDSLRRRTGIVTDLREAMYTRREFARRLREAGMKSEADLEWARTVAMAEELRMTDEGFEGLYQKVKDESGIK